MVKEGQPDKALWEATFKEVFSSFEAGYGKSLASAEYNTPDWEYLQQVKFNSAVWSAFKQNSQIKDAARMLLDDQGKAVPWKEFRDKAMQIDDTYNKRYLQTEYNQAHNTAMQARRWRDAEKTADLYPNMIYIAVQDGRTRATHMALHGTIRPINDPFWSKYTPPLDWGCRCTLRPTDKKTTSQPAELPSVTDGMDNNPGVDGKIFSDNHPYIKGNTDRANELMAWVGSQIRSSGEIKARLEEFNLPDKDFKPVFFDGNSGGYVIQHKSAKGAELKDNIDTGKLFAKQGLVVKILQKTDDHGVKSIDSITDDFLNEYKTPDVIGKNSVNNNVKDAQKKARNLNVKTDLTFKYKIIPDKEGMRDWFADSWRRAPKLRNLYIWEGNRLWGPYTAEQVLKKDIL